MARNAEDPQRCVNCGALIADFQQWFLEEGPSHWAGHSVEAWQLLQFIDALEAARRYHTGTRS
jgi:hypothetical protein